MKKKIFGLALALMTVGTLSSFAANTNDKKCDKQDCQKQQCDKKAGECKKGDRQCLNPFEGLNLTADQQSKLNELKESCCKARKDNKDNKADRVDPRQAKRDFLAKVKGILTPEQYVTFLENNFTNGRPHMDKANRQGDKKDMKGQRQGKRGDKKDMKGQRPEKRQNNRDKK